MEDLTHYPLLLVYGRLRRAVARWRGGLVAAHARPGRWRWVD
jgi:hypothetical protein